MMYSLFLYTFMGAIASFGFAILFNIKGNRRIYASIGGGIGVLVYQFALSQNLTLALSMFLASLILSLYCEIIARVLRAPVTLFLVVALIPLVPGGGMYRMMLAIIQSDITMFTKHTLDTLFAASSLAIGSMVASSAVRVFYKVRGRKK